MSKVRRVNFFNVRTLAPVIITDKDAEFVDVTQRLSTGIGIDKLTSNVRKAISEECSIARMTGSTEYLYIYLGKRFHGIPVKHSELTEFLIEEDLQLGLMECLEDLNISLIIYLNYHVLCLQDVWELNLSFLTSG